MVPAEDTSTRSTLVQLQVNATPDCSLALVGLQQQEGTYQGIERGLAPGLFPSQIPANGRHPAAAQQADRLHPGSNGGGDDSGGGAGHGGGAVRRRRFFRPRSAAKTLAQRAWGTAFPDKSCQHTLGITGALLSAQPACVHGKHLTQCESPWHFLPRYGRYDGCSFKRTSRHKEELWVPDANLERV